MHAQQTSILTPTEANSGVYPKSDSIMLPEMFFFLSAQLTSPSTLPGSVDMSYQSYFIARRIIPLTQISRMMEIKFLHR